MTNVADYNKARNRLSYQLGKYLINKFKFAPNQANSRDFNWSDYKTPLKDYDYFDSVFSAYLSLYYQRHYEFKNQNVIAFTYPFSIRELMLFLHNLAKNSSQELTIVLKGHHYEDELERQRAYEELIELIAESKCNFIVHFVLITKDNVDSNLLNLKPHSQEKIEGFQPLAHGAGYYFSSAKATSLIYREIQARETVKIPGYPV